MLERMAACLWYVLSLPAFFIPALASVPGLVSPCMAGWLETCEEDHRARIATAVEEVSGSQLYDKICLAMQIKSICMMKECAGQVWDSGAVFVNKQLQFSQANGLCGKKAQTNVCSQNVAKKCLNRMAKSIQNKGEYCEYYLAYAKCVINKLPDCDDQLGTTFADEMKRQVREELPLVLGGRTFRTCYSWVGVVE